MTDGDKYVFLNKLKLNKIWFESGSSKIVFGPAKRDLNYAVYNIYLPIIAGLIFLTGAVLLFNFGKIKFGLFIVGLSFLIYAYRSSGIYSQKKEGNRNYKILEDNSIVFVIDDDKVVFNKDNVLNIHMYKKEVLEDLYRGEISIVSEENELKFIELSGMGAVVDLFWISEFLANYIGLPKTCITSRKDEYNGIPIFNLK